MKEQQVESDIHLFIGETYDSNSTAFVKGDEVLLVDALASRRDAEELRERVEGRMKKRVRFVVATHYFSDHLAALRLFPGAEVIAHRNYLHTFTTERHRTREEEANFVEPTMLVDDSLLMRWGRHTLDVFHNPGHTMSTLSIEAPEADLLLTGDTVVGHIVYLAYTAPEMLRGALRRLQRRGRSRLISSHMGLRDGRAVGHALVYLDRLEANARAAWREGESGEAVLRIPLADCLSPEVEGTPFEELFHGRNLESIVNRRLLVPERG